MAFLHHIESVFQLIVQYGVLLLECFGVAILVCGEIPMSVWTWLKELPWRWNSNWEVRFCGP